MVLFVWTLKVFPDLDGTTRASTMQVEIAKVGVGPVGTSGFWAVKLLPLIPEVLNFEYGGRGIGRKPKERRLSDKRGYRGVEKLIWEQEDNKGYRKL